MPSIGIGIGTHKPSGVSKWTPLKPLGGETPSFWVKENSRSGLTLTDSVNAPTGNIAILPSHVSRNTSTGTVSYTVADNGGLDIGTQDFTLFGRFRNENTTKAAIKTLICKGSGNNMYILRMLNTSGYLSAFIQVNEGTTYSIDSTVDFTNLAWHTLRLAINYATKMAYFYVDNNLVGSGTSFAGKTFAVNPIGEKFNIGQRDDGSTSANYTSVSDVMVFHRLWTTQEAVDAENFIYPDNATSHWPMLGGNTDFEYDVKGNYNITCTNVKITDIAYSTGGSRQGLNIGYTRHILYPNKEIQIPYSKTGTPCGTVPSGYTKDADIPGDSLNHNGANSYLMPVAGTMDRSNTTECTKLAIESGNPFYYDVVYKAGLHSQEVSNRNNASFFTNSYRGKNFFKRNGRKITDWVHYTTNKTGANYDKVIAWTGENMNFAYGAGTHLSMGIYNTYASSVSLRLGASLAKEGPFAPIAHPTLEAWGYTHVGNAKVLPLNTNKCNGTTAPVVGEANFIMTFECLDAALASVSAPVYKSHNGLDWKYITHFPNSPVFTGGGCWFIDNDDPTDYTNIHYISFKPDTHEILETHPLNVSFTSWSAAVVIFNVGVTLPYNPVVVKIGTTYHMFYSAYIIGDNTHYVHWAKGTTGVFTATNDWANFQTGNWSGLGSCESFSLLNTGGSNWILYSWELVSGSRYNYATSANDLVTWSAQTAIPSLNTPLQVSVDVLRLK